VSSPVEVSVVVPTYRGAGHIGTCLRSLAEQTMDPDRFEVVVVLNGPRDGTPDVIAAIRAEYPALRLRAIRMTQTGAGRARNVGMWAARGAYVAFVDDDDSVSAEYLEVLRAHTGPRTVGLAQMADVPEGGGPPDFLSSGSTRWQLRHREPTVPASALPGALGYTAAKMLPTELARRVGFDEHLRSGEDVAFWAQVVAALPFTFGLCPVEHHAVYYRTLRADSISRQQLSYDFNVVQRLDVLQLLDHVLLTTGSREVSKVVRALQSGQVGFINRFLREQPEHHVNVVHEVRRRGLRTLPFEQVNKGVARDLAILYIALPYADTSALVAARRIRRAEVLRDVLSSDMSSTFGKDESAQAIWHEFVDDHAETATRPCSAWWPGILDYCRKGMRQIEEWEAEKGRYRSVYSRVMWPSAHVLAAWYKIRNPETHWVAEFSDPLLHGIHGQVREGSGQMPEEFRDELSEAIAARGFTPPETDNVYVWIEVLAYALADTIMFTNQHQRSYMLDYLDDPALVRRVHAHSVVEPHPTLPQEFYEVVTSSYALDPRLVNIAYFGVFYATRGLTEVVEALRTLAPEARAQIRLHVFTARPSDLEAEMREAGLSDVIVANPYVSYLEFLNLTTHFDALLVNDAHTKDSHSVNPYMPSKWSDYAGSGRPIWGVIEPGSELSTRPLAHLSELGDAAGARAVLEAVVAAKEQADEPLQVS